MRKRGFWTMVYPIQFKTDWCALLRTIVGKLEEHLVDVCGRINIDAKWSLHLKSETLCQSFCCSFGAALRYKLARIIVNTTFEDQPWTEIPTCTRVISWHYMTLPNLSGGVEWFCMCHESWDEVVSSAVGPLALTVQGQDSQWAWHSSTSASTSRELRETDSVRLWSFCRRLAVLVACCSHVGSNLTTKMLQ